MNTYYLILRKMDRAHKTKRISKASAMNMDPYDQARIKLLTYVSFKYTCMPFIQPLTLFVELIEASLPQAGRAATELRVPLPRGDLQSKLLLGNHACLE